MPDRLQPSFAAGEIAPSLHGRVDLAKFQVALKLCRNWIVRPQGGAFTRAGTEFVCRAKYDQRYTRLLPFSFNNTQTYVIEAGDSYFRFISNGGQVVDGGVPYEVATPWTDSHMPNLHFAQSADVMTLTHPDVSPKNLSRLGHTNWTVTDVTLGATIAAPAAPTVTPNLGSGSGTTITYSYVVTAVDASGEESPPSSPGSADNYTLSSVDGITNTVTWSAVTGAVSYNVYKSRNGIYGWIGGAGSTTFTDDNIRADTTDTPPQTRDIFAGSSYPTAVGYYEQRRVYGGGNVQPDQLNLSQSGIYNNFNVSSPIKADDAIQRAIASDQVQDVRHIVGLQDMLVFTGTSAWKVSSGSADALTPTSMTAKRQADIGVASDVPPVVAKEAVLVLEDGGQTLYDLGYQFAVDRYVPNDLSILAQHLFDNHRVVAMAWAQRPHKVVWCVRDDGIAMALTYQRDQDVYAWSRHDTDGQFLNVCVVREGGVDAVYFLVQRLIDGERRYYIERLRDRYWTAVEDAWCLDAALRYEGDPTTSLSGLDHLEGKVVQALADGNVVPALTVVSGAVTLPYAATKVVIGLPYVCDLQTLNPNIGLKRRIARVTLRVLNTRGLKVGPDADHLEGYKERTTEAYDVATQLRSADIGPIVIQPQWDSSSGASLLIRQDSPLPAEVLGVMVEDDLGR